MTISHLDTKIVGTHKACSHPVTQKLVATIDHRQNKWHVTLGSHIELSTDFTDTAFMSPRAAEYFVLAVALEHDERERDLQQLAEDEASEAIGMTAPSDR